jgi:hypothetical protein
MVIAVSDARAVCLVWTLSVAPQVEGKVTKYLQKRDVIIARSFAENKEITDLLMV